MLRIEFDRAVERQFSSLPLKHKRQVFVKIQALAINPLPPDSRVLKGKSSEWRRATSGEYRVIYKVEADALIIAAVGHRNDDKVYRDFERKM